MEAFLAIRHDVMFTREEDLALIISVGDGGC